MRQLALRTARGAARTLTSRGYSTASAKPRHFTSINDLAPAEFATLVRNASAFKQSFQKGALPASVTKSLAGQTIAVMFNKRSTRTRVSTEAAVAMLGGHPMFLGSNDIQLGVIEPLSLLQNPLLLC